MASIPPSQTVYLRNLNEKIRKEELKEALYNLCIPFGRIMDIIALKTMKMRGQAFIVFWDIVSATNALRHLDGFVFYDKPIQAEYALSKSVAVIRLENGGILPKKPEQMSAERRKRLLGISEDKAGPKVSTGIKRSQEDDGHQQGGSDEEGSDGREAKRQALDTGENMDELNANPRLFVEGLPNDATESLLSGLFGRHSGYKETRMVPGKPGIAFVEYESTTQAMEAKRILDGFKVTSSHAMRISFAQR